MKQKTALLRISIGIIYLWFGILKFFPELSPAEELAKSTISIITFGLFSDAVSYLILAVWESLIGLLLIFNFFPRTIIIVALIHMVGTFMPLIVISEVTFNEQYMSLTLIGQYIMKNLVVLSALIMIFPSKKERARKIKYDVYTIKSNTNFSKFLTQFISLKTSILKTLLLVSLVALGACKKEPVTQLESLKDGTYFHNSVKKLTDIIVHDIFSPPVASRVYTYPNIAAYECMVLGNQDYTSLAGQLTGLTAPPQPEKNQIYNYEVASLKAFLVVGKAFIFSEEKFDAYETELFNQIQKEGLSEDIIKRSIEYGTTVAEHILAWANEDNYKQTRSFPKHLISKSDSLWQPTPPDYIESIEPHWNKIRPFVIDSATQFIPVKPTAFDLSKNSPFYKEIMEVYTIGNNLSTEETEIAKFWDCNPFVSYHSGHAMFAIKKITPGGHWIGITSIAAKKKELNFQETVEAYTRVSITMADAFISCWDEKYRSVLIRPETLINQYIDEDWTPLLQTPPFPEYTSGHSVVSGAISIVLTDLFGDNFQFNDTSELEFGLPVRQFSSFNKAANEAAISRIYGGIHYMPAINNGLKQGRKVGDYVVNNLVTKKAAN